MRKRNRPGRTIAPRKILYREWSESEQRKIREKILLNVNVNECGCWVWQGAIGSKGYGMIGAFGATTLAHRVAIKAWGMQLIDGLCIDHLCRNRLCVNPEHFEQVSIKENVLRGVGISADNARKSVCKRGHELTQSSYGPRICKTCKANQARGYREKKRANAVPT